MCFTKSGSLTNLKVNMGEGVGIEGWRLGVGGFNNLHRSGEFGGWVDSITGHKLTSSFFSRLLMRLLTCYVLPNLPPPLISNKNIDYEN